MSVFTFSAMPGVHYRPRLVGPQMEEVEVIVAGRGRFSTRDGRGELSAGGMAWYQPGDAVEVWAHETTPYRCIVFSFQIREPSRRPPPGLGEWCSAEDCIRFVETAKALGDGGRALPEFLAHCHYARLLWEAHEFQRRRLELALATPVRAVLEFVERRSAEPLDMACLARHAGVSVSHLHLLFRRQVGVSPMNHVNRVRLRQARELLQSSRMSVKEICARVGLPDPRNFCKVFRKSLAMSPTEYRARFLGAPSRGRVAEAGGS